MIKKHVGEEFDFVASDGTPGLVGQITFEVYDPLDPDAVIIAPRTTGITEPRPGTYVAAGTIGVAGRYMGRLVEPEGLVAEEPIVIYDVGVPIDDTEPRTPSVDDVGSILRARTVDHNGNELGTFTTDTRPTGGEVENFIADAVGELTVRLPDDLTDVQEAFVKRLTAIRAAMFVEISLHPDSDQNEGSAYARLEKMFDQGWAALSARLEDGTGRDGRLVSVPLESPYSPPAALSDLDFPWPLP